jgi:hypothetical protein
MQMLLTEKRIVANRHNAILGGVKTAIGKAVSRQNALQHGILSKEAVITKGEMRESKKEFTQLRDELFGELAPVGFIERMLVDKILMTYWRWRRIVRVESALIEQQESGYKFRQMMNRGDESMHHSSGGMYYFKERTKTSTGCIQLLKKLEEVESWVKDKGLPLPEDMDNILVELGLHDGFPLAHNINLFNTLVKHAEGLEMPEQGKKNSAKTVLNDIKKYRVFLETSRDIWQGMEEEGDVIGAKAQLLPSEKDLNRIQRYESHLHKLFMQNLHELQRMQAMRLGKPVTLPQALDLNINSENGFVS